MSTCAVCQEAMDMQEFNDTREKTESCYKLECKHAYHTKCVIDFLKRTSFDCITCNRHKLPREEIRKEGIARQCLEDVHNSKKIRKLRRELKQLNTELRKSYNVQKRKITKIVKEIARESNIPKLRSKLKAKQQKIIKTVKKMMLKKSPQYAGSLYYLSEAMILYGFDRIRYPFRHFDSSRFLVRI